jgi:glycosyltransferase involved in cell wall biosynthesis
VRVLVVNNSVRLASGTDAFVAAEMRALAARGHAALAFNRDNNIFDGASRARRVALLASSAYSLSARAEMSLRLRNEHVDVVHLHNLVPFVTGSVYDACRKHAVPTVQHLHNYRAFCLSSYAYRDGHSCDDCYPTGFAACARYGCYRDSRVASAGLVAARWIDWARGRKTGYGADRYIATSAFMRTRHVEHGLPAGAVSVLHNPADDLGALRGDRGQAEEDPAFDPALTFVGSLISAKGPWKLLDLAAALPEFDVRFIGAGRDEQALKQAARRRRLANVTFYGHLVGQAKANVWARSFLTVVPSLWDEPFGIVVPESYSLGVPVLATSTGGLAETVVAGTTGLGLDVARIGAAAAQIRELWADRPRYAAMRAAARAEYELRYTERVFAERLEALLLEAAERR